MWRTTSAFVATLTEGVLTIVCWQTELWFIHGPADGTPKKGRGFANSDILLLSVTVNIPFRLVCSALNILISDDIIIYILMVAITTI